MKPFICAIVIILAFLIARLRNDDLKNTLNKYNELSVFSDLLSRNFKTEIKSVSLLCSEYFTELTGNDMSFSGIDEAVTFIKNRYPFQLFTDTFCELIKACTTAPPEELNTLCQKLSEISHTSYEEMAEKYKKESGTSYIIYPGIAALLAAIII